MLTCSHAWVIFYPCPAGTCGRSSNPSHIIAQNIWLRCQFWGLSRRLGRWLGCLRRGGPPARTGTPCTFHDLSGIRWTPCNSGTKGRKELAGSFHRLCQGSWKRIRGQSLDSVCSSSYLTISRWHQSCFQRFTNTSLSIARSLERLGTT